METIHSLVTYVGVSHGDMEKGNLRADANVSIRPKGATKLGTRAEVKNVNSFRFVREAVEYEIERQSEELRAGKTIRQETRLYDPVSKTTHAMRAKEEAHDYRYFPEPDLPVVRVDEAWLEEIKRSMPELPDVKAARFQERFGLSAYDAGVLVASRETAEFYEAVIAAGADPKAAARWVSGDLAAKLNEDKSMLGQLKFSPAQLAELLGLVADGTLSGRMAKAVFDEMYAGGGGAREIVVAKGLTQVSDSGAIERIIDQIISANPGQVEQFRSGKDKVFGFFVGQVMKASQGQANPQVVNDLLRRKLA
jgi:aspartyl-tRNA(Asn)/glutamyl-tRNA(Gln) amidotransferase subunit B